MEGISEAKEERGPGELRGLRESAETQSEFLNMTVELGNLECQKQQEGDQLGRRGSGGQEGSISCLTLRLVSV